MPISLTKRGDQLDPLDEAQLDGNWTAIEDEIDAIDTALGLLNSALGDKANASVQIIAGTGLADGGNLGANVTLNLSAASVASLAKADSAMQAANVWQRGQFLDRSIADAVLGGSLSVAHTGANNLDITTTVSNDSDAHLRFRKAQGGTPEAPVDILDDTTAALGTVEWFGRDGGNWVSAAEVRCESQGDPVGSALKNTVLVFDVKQGGNMSFRVGGTTRLTLNGATGVLDFQQTPAAPTPAPGDNSTKVATTAFVATEGLGILAMAASTFPTRVATGATAMGTAEILSGAAAPVVTVAASGVLATDLLSWSFRVDPNTVTGYAGTSTSGRLVIDAYPSAGNVNFVVSNPTASPITPGALTLNWRVLR